MEYPKFKVCVKCFTFNQSKYIVDAMDGFCMQQTDFPFVCCIVDDASTDGEQDVIMQYLSDNFNLTDSTTSFKRETDFGHITYARHKSNGNCFFAVILLKDNHYSQKKYKSPYLAEWRDFCDYEALCEGDDYWIHPHKLNMQVQFMETHLEYSLCHTDFALSSSGWRNHHIYLAPNDDYSILSVTNGMQVGTLTALFRVKMVNRCPHVFHGKGWKMGDLPLWIELSQEGKVKYLSVITACYRVLSNSASHGSIEKEISFANDTISVRKFYADYYGIKLANNGYSKDYYTTIMKYAYKHKDKNVAEEYWNKARLYNMASLKLFMFYMAIVSPAIGLFLKKFLRVK